MSTSFDWDGQQQLSREWRQRIEAIHPDEYLQRLEEAGWFDAVGSERGVDLRQRLRDVLEENPAFSFYELADTEFDTDCIEEAGTDDSCSYYSIIMQLSHDSRNLFAPEQVEDSLDREAGVARVSFVHGGRRFETEVAQHDDCFQEPVLQLVNEALAEASVEHRFIDLPACNQTMCLVLVPESVYTAAIQSGLIPDVRFYSPGDE